MFGPFDGGSSVCTEIGPSASKAILQAIIRGKADVTSVMHTYRRRGYVGLVEVGFKNHLRVNHCKNELARGNAHVKGNKSFWSYAKRRLVKFNSIPRRTF